MKKLSRLFFLLFATFLLAVSACSAQDTADPAKDKQEIVSLVKALYKVNPSSYYFAEFPKYSEEKLSELADKYFVNELSARRNAKTQKIDPKGRVSLPPLYPLEDDMENLQLKINARELPKVKIDVPELDGQRGKVVAKLSDSSLVQFFLQRRPEGWRIYKVRTFTRVPRNLYFLPGLKALEDAYDGDMDEYPSAPTSPSFRTSNQASVKLSPW